MFVSALPVRKNIIALDLLTTLMSEDVSMQEDDMLLGIN